MKARNPKSQGFTLVELLIVIIVIGILAAITLVAYNGVQDRANNAAVASDANTIAKKLAIYNVENGHYPTSIADINSITDMKLSVGSYDTTQNNVYYYYDGNKNIYAFGLRSKALQGYMVVDGTVSIVGNGGAANISGAATNQAVANAGGTATIGITFFTAGTGWLSGFSWVN